MRRKGQAKRPLRLSSRMLLVSGLILLAMLAARYVLWGAVVHWNTDLTIQRELHANARQIGDGLVLDALGRPLTVSLPSRLQAAYEVLKQDSIYRVLDRGGRVLLASDQDGVAFALPRRAFDPGLRDFVLQQAGQALHVTTMPLDLRGGHYFVQVARSERFHLAMLDNDGRKAQSVAIKAFAVAMSVFSIVVGVTFYRTLKPLRRASEAAARIDPGNLTARLPTEGMPPELAPLILAFNQALQRLQDGYRVQQEFLATAAHELKTPLALMRGQIELDGVLDRKTLLADIDHMGRQVHQLLHLAEVSERQNYVFETVDPRLVAEDVLAHIARLAERRGVSMVLLATSQPLAIAADRGALFVLLRNLLENAILHTPAGGEVGLELDPAWLRVRDSGPGIAPGEHAMLFKRFWRGAASQGEGAGLGLAICHEIAQVHGWSIAVRNLTRPEAGACGGAEFTLRLDPGAGPLPQPA